jgi:hypothetical protein
LLTALFLFARLQVFGIIALVLVVTVLLLWHNFRVSLWLCEVLARTPACLRRCWRSGREARASARAPAEECAPAPPPTVWETHYNEAYAYAPPKECCIAPADKSAAEEAADCDESGARLRAAELGEVDVLGPLPRVSAPRSARGSGGRASRAEMLAHAAALQAAPAAGAPRADGYAPR